MIHNMDRVRERFGEYIDKMFNEFGFGSVAEEGYTNAEDALWQWDNQDAMADHYGLWFDCGATRIVMGDENDDYIIKFQTDGCGVDYGSIEATVYADAIKEGFESKFVFCEKLFDYVHVAKDGTEYCYPIYVYERVYCSYDTISDDSYDYHYKSFCEQEDIDPELDSSRDRYYQEDGRYSGSAEMMEFAFNFWHEGLEFQERFIRFLRKHYVNDMHAGNWGYRDNELVMTDYAGYGELGGRSDIMS